MPEVINPVENADDRFFWEGAAEGKLLLQWCTGCDTVRHPPSPMCPRCHSLAWEAREASGRGTVYSWVLSHHPTAGDPTPRIVVLVELAEGVRLVSNLAGVEPSAVRNDMAVEVFFERFGDVTLPQFRPTGA